MKYVLMFTASPDQLAAVDPAVHEEVYQRVYRWFGENAAHFADTGAELHPVTTATTVKHGDSGPVVVDGPFNEAKEVIGGFSILDVPDLDTAIEIVKTWPQLDLAGVAVEIRPMVEDYSQFE